MRLVFVNRYFFPDHSATSQMLSDLAFDLATDAFEVHVVTSRLSYDDPTATFPSLELVGGVCVHRVWTSHFGRKKLLGRLFDYATFYPMALLALLRVLRRGDIAVAKTDPPLISVVVALAAWLRRATLVNWLQDVFPEVATALNVRGANIVSKVLMLVRNRTLSSAAANVVVGERMARTIVALGVPEPTIRIVPNWVDGDAIKPRARDAHDLRRQWNLSDKFVVGYSGNAGRAHEFDTLYDAAKLLRDDASIIFLFIGGGHHYAQLQARVAAAGLQNFIFKPYQPADMLPESLTAPDVHFISLRPELEGLIVPSKFYAAAAAGKPVLFVGEESGEISQAVKTFHCGAAYHVGDASGLAGAITMLSRNFQAAESWGKNARYAFEQHFERGLAMAKWRALLHDIRTVSANA